MGGKRAHTCLTLEQRTRLEAWAYAWARAVELEYKRVHPDANGTFGDGQIDAMLFVMALAKLHAAAVKLLGSNHPAVLAFRSATVGADTMRDLLEHFEDYETGDGRLQQVRKKQPDPPVTEFKVSFARDESSMTVVINGNLSLRVDIAYQAAMALHLKALGG